MEKQASWIRWNRISLKLLQEALFFPRFPLSVFFKIQQFFLLTFQAASVCYTLLYPQPAPYFFSLDEVSICVEFLQNSQAEELLL